jgi:Zn-dependent M28 family amino/carboxypeptidase
VTAASATRPQRQGGRRGRRDHLQRRRRRRPDGDHQRHAGQRGNGGAVGTTLAIGQDLANGVTSGDTGTVTTLKIDRVEETRTTRNIVAETPGGNADDVVVVGAHLDSVPRGAGINDNGSGSGGILEIAEALAARDDAPRNKVRFMWYSAEEFGLLGSRAYVDGLSQAERDRIEAMLNVDMIGARTTCASSTTGTTRRTRSVRARRPGPRARASWSGSSATTSRRSG